MRGSVVCRCFEVDIYLLEGQAIIMADKMTLNYWILTSDFQHPCSNSVILERTELLIGKIADLLPVPYLCHLPFGFHVSSMVWIQLYQFDRQVLFGKFGLFGDKTINIVDKMTLDAFITGSN